MYGQPYFRFDIELTPEQNPPGLYDQLREDLRAWIVERRLDAVVPFSEDADVLAPITD